MAFGQKYPAPDDDSGSDASICRGAEGVWIEGQGCDWSAYCERQGRYWTGENFPECIDMDPPPGPMPSPKPAPTPPMTAKVAGLNLPFLAVAVALVGAGAYWYAMRTP